MKKNIYLFSFFFTIFVDFHNNTHLHPLTPLDTPRGVGPTHHPTQSTLLRLLYPTKTKKWLSIAILWPFEIFEVGGIFCHFLPFYTPRPPLPKAPVIIGLILGAPKGFFLSRYTLHRINPYWWVKIWKTSIFGTHQGTMQ